MELHQPRTHHVGTRVWVANTDEVWGVWTWIWIKTGLRKADHPADAGPYAQGVRPGCPSLPKLVNLPKQNRLFHALNALAFLAGLIFFDFSRKNHCTMFPQFGVRERRSCARVC
jgi:hypothetical protein